MNNSSLMVEEYNSERMTSIVIDVETNDLSESIESPLKSILKKPSDYFGDRIIKLRVMKICILSILIIIYIPLIFCDIYYSLIDVSCVNEGTPYLDITLKLYLLLSGFINLILLITIIITIILIKDFENKSSIAYLLTLGNSYVSGLFNLVWNIIGSLIFWGYIYNNGTCKIGLSTYIFISLMIKLLGSFLSIYYFYKK